MGWDALDDGEPGDGVAPPPPSPTLGRYAHLGLIGEGGMGEVRRVRDPELNRAMAMKVLRRELAAVPSLVARFVEEAQVAAQLQHPGIPPVHELGRPPDGRPDFTMPDRDASAAGLRGSVGEGAVTAARPSS